MLERSPGAPSFEKSQAAQKRLDAAIPGGAHTYARGSDQYPENMAPVLVRGRGARVEDLDGNIFVEYGMGLRSVTLGHAHPAVVDAVARAARDGVNFSRPTVYELLAAEAFLDNVPGADMVKFAKNGSDVTTAAVKVARAVTGRPMVAICSTQPFFSTDDWFIVTTEMDAGIPRGVADLTTSFKYGDMDSVDEAFERYPDQIACFVLEPATALRDIDREFLVALRERLSERGTLLIFDEMITGMRWSAGGAQALCGVRPDLSTWGKALGNGFAISALAGRREYLEIGGLNTDAERAFLLSTTHGPETTGLAALIAVLGEYRRWDVVGTMERQGAKLQLAFNESARQAGLLEHVAAIGRSSCMVFTTKDDRGRPSQAMRTLFMQGLLSNGVLAQSLVISAAHTDDDLDVTVSAVCAALPAYRQAIERGSTDGLLRGRPVAPAIRRFAAPRRLGSGAFE